MHTFVNLVIGLLFFGLCSCGQGKQNSNESERDLNVNEEVIQESLNNKVIGTIMDRRSIRKYKPQAIESEKLQRILECGINAPNGMYKQSWEIRVVNNIGFMEQIEEGYSAFMTKIGKKRITHPSFGAPCLVFIAHDTKYDLSQVDCGLLGGNIILSAQSMGLGTCCLGGIVRYMNSVGASGLLKRLELPASYRLLYAIAIGYPDEKPTAKPRNKEKIKFIN